MLRKRGQDDLQVTRLRHDDDDKAQITRNEMDYHQDRHTDHAEARYDDDNGKEEIVPYADFDALAEELLNRDIPAMLRELNVYAYEKLMLANHAASSVEGMTSQAATSTAGSFTVTRGRSAGRTSFSTLVNEGKRDVHECKVGVCWTGGCKHRI